jgi:predicted anti-sigma-YlaC factor YlaD
MEVRIMKVRLGFGFLVLLIITAVFGSCSINRVAVRAVSDALTGEGSSDVFTGDDDPELVGDALPFAIKMYESLLSANPRHGGLILTTGSLFVMYANAFVQGPASMLPFDRYQEREAANLRAKKLYLRGAALLYSGLDLKYPGFSGASLQDGTLEGFLAKTKKEDVPLLYWIVAGRLSAWSLDPFDLELGTRVRDLAVMIHRAYELDPDFNRGAIDDFYILFYASLPEGLGGDKSRTKVHFDRAVEKSGGLLAGPYVSWAESVCIPSQDYPSFKENLEKALAVDPGADPGSRLVNILSQRKARYLLDSAPDYFIDLETGDEWYDDYSE